MTPEQVDGLRANEVTVIPGWILVLAGAIGGLIVLALIVWAIRRHRRAEAIAA